MTDGPIYGSHVKKLECTYVCIMTRDQVQFKKLLFIKSKF